MHVGILIVAGIVIFLSFAMSVIGQYSVYLPGSMMPLPSSCTARLLFGMECPGCGMTRAFISISHGEFANAWQFNPASFVVYLFVLVQLPWQIYQMSRIWRGWRAIEAGWIYILPITMAVLMVAQWLIRMAL